MKTLRLLLSIPLGLTLTVAAEVPRKKDINSYSLLWNQSIFTSKPPPVAPGEQVSAFADWTLGGVSEIDGGHMVTLFNTKKQGEAMIIRPDSVVIHRGDTMERLKPGDPGTFTVNKVEYGKNSWKETVVTIASGGRTEPVKFDDKQIQPKAAAAPPPTPQNRQGQPGNAQQPVPGQQRPQAAGGGGRQPRPRVVPPPQGQQQQQPQQQQGR